MTSTHRPQTILDLQERALVIHDVAIRSGAVVEEARRWATGIRGEIADDAAIAEADLTPFIEQAIAVGTLAISGAGGVQETANVHRLIDDLERRTDAATKEASAATKKAVTEASAVLKATTEEARAGFESAATSTRKSIKESVDEARTSLADEIRRLVGGDSPELLAKLGPVLDTFGHNLDERARKQTEELIAKVARQFDADDPTSPMAKQARELEVRHQALSESLDKGQQAIEAKIGELSKEIAVQSAAKDSAATGVTTLKGVAYETAVHRHLEQIAAGLGDEYQATGVSVGRGSTGKKGDGVLTVDGGDTKIVLEMTDSSRTGWNDYLAKAEQIRGAVASIGLARTAKQLGGHTVRVIGPRRILLAFDPETGDTDLLRTIIQVVRTAALAAGRRQDSQEIATAQECIDEAITLLVKIDGIKKLAGTITNNASKIDREADALSDDLTTVLSRAQRALVHSIADNTDQAA